jgi:hypothetical protein
VFTCCPHAPTLTPSNCTVTPPITGCVLVHSYRTIPVLY